MHAIIRGASQAFEYPMLDRAPVDAWSFGRATLLGDAANPMYPIGSNGARHGIRDARRLAWHLVEQPASARRPAVVRTGRRAGGQGVSPLPSPTGLRWCPGHPPSRS